MIVVYNCFGGTHSSVIAASLHVGRLPADRLPTPEEIERLPFYDRIPKRMVGSLHYIGTDEDDNEVYALGIGKHKDIVRKAILSLLKLYNLEEQILLVDASKKLNIITRIGGFTARQLGIVSVGRPLTVYGVRKGYFGFVNLVQETKLKIKKKTKITR
ncbi:MAG: DUF3189 family protein [Firmicutes bacterium]|nr:DUF3189 family protein [Bacillota bacterium]